jgi:multiple sugar transport system ATP-binding protein
MATLELKDIHKSFGTTPVLQNISLQLEDGEFLVLVGPSGCGKSTLMNIVAGLEEPTQGRLLLAGEDITDKLPADRNISMVFQSYALYPNMTVARNIEFPLKMRKVDPATRAARIAQVAQLLQIEHLLDRKPRQLSGGQRQRVAIGRALAREPQLFLFDEPLSNLDAKLRVDMRAEIKKLHQRTGVTTIYVTHDQVEAMTLGSRIAVLKGGIIQQLAPPMTLYRDPANLFVAGFIGSPAINEIEAVATGDHSVRMLGDTDFQLQLTSPLRTGQKLVAGIRPEHLRLDANGALRGTMTVLEPTGAEDFVRCTIGTQELNMRISGHHDFAVGKILSLTVDPAHILLFDPESGNRIR